MLFCRDRGGGRRHSRQHRAFDALPGRAAPVCRRRRPRWTALATQKADLQGELAKLSETGYLETLAREQLTYVRPGEELYIVTKRRRRDDGRRRRGGSRAPRGRRGGVTLERGRRPERRAVTGLERRRSRRTGSTGADDAGFLESIISAIRGLF